MRHAARLSDKREVKIKENLVFDGHVIKLYNDDVKCPNGNEAKREIIKHPGGVCIMGFVDNKIIFEKQYRYAYDEELYELPAGKLESGEDPYTAALREFEEETGYKANTLVDFGCMYPTCGYSNEVIYLYLADEITKTARHLDPDEVIDVVYLSLDEVKKMISNDTIKDAKTICLVSKFLLSLE